MVGLSSTGGIILFNDNALIMHQHPAVANEVGMEILYLKVVDSNGFFQALGDNIGDDSFGAIGKPHDHAGVQSTCLDPALALNVEGMLRGGVDGFGLAVLGGKMVAKSIRTSADKIQTVPLHCLGSGTVYDTDRPSTE